MSETFYISSNYIVLLSQILRWTLQKLYANNVSLNFYLIKIIFEYILSNIYPFERMLLILECYLILFDST